MKKIICSLLCVSALLVSMAQEKGGLTAKVFLQETSNKSVIDSC